MSSVSFNIKVTVEVQPEEDAKNEKVPKEPPTTISLSNFNRFKEWYCDVCESLKNKPDGGRSN